MELGERRRKILAAVVDDYVKTAEPIGSEYLAEKYNFGVKPATIRNELAAMSDMGYLRQPHTSAGRVPSDMGYRYYVDRLMPSPSLEPLESYQARESYDPRGSEVDIILHQTCRILSGLTHYTSIATPPRIDTVEIKHIVLSAISHRKVLLVTVLNTGHVDHRVIECSEPPRSADLMSLANLINSRFHGVDVEELAGRSMERLPAGFLGLKDLYTTIVSVLRQALLNAENGEIYMDGASHILKHPEFSQSDRAALVLEALAQRRALFQVLSRSLLGEDVTVIIGSENQFEEMQECSFIACRYSVGNRVCGSIGVMGPTRMDYRRAVAAVRFMSHNLSDLLTSLSIG